MPEAGREIKFCHLWMRKIAAQRVQMTARGCWECSLRKLASTGSRTSLALLSAARKRNLCHKPSFPCKTASTLWPLSTEVRCKPTCKHCRAFDLRPTATPLTDSTYIRTCRRPASRAGLLAMMEYSGQALNMPPQTTDAYWPLEMWLLQLMD